MKDIQLKLTPEAEKALNTLKFTSEDPDMVVSNAILASRLFESNSYHDLLEFLQDLSPQAWQFIVTTKTPSEAINNLVSDNIYRGQ